MSTGGFQTNITLGAISEQLVPQDMQGERVHEWNSNAVQRFPRDPLQLRLFPGSLSSWPVRHGALHGPTLLLLHMETATPTITWGGGGCCWSKHFCDHCKVGGWVGKPSRTPGRRMQVFFFFLSLYSDIIWPNLSGLRRYWSWSVTWLPKPFSFAHINTLYPVPMGKPCLSLRTALTSVRRNSQITASNCISRWLGLIWSLISCT